MTFSLDRAVVTYMKHTYHSILECAWRNWEELPYLLQIFILVMKNQHNDKRIVEAVQCWSIWFQYVTWSCAIVGNPHHCKKPARSSGWRQVWISSWVKSKKQHQGAVRKLSQSSPKGRPCVVHVDCRCQVLRGVWQVGRYESALVSRARSNTRGRD